MFITLEGVEGSGKTTLIKLLAEKIQEQGQRVVITREPGGSNLGKLLRPVLLSPGHNLTLEAELLLFLADRAQHVAECIQPALDSGYVVLCDRYVDSTTVYQGYVRGFDINFIQRLNEVAVKGCWPDKTFVLDMDPCKALSRAINRNCTTIRGAGEDRFEEEDINFHVQVREGFLRLAAENPGRIAILNADVSIDALLQQVVGALQMEAMPLTL